jgi:hypothetical protein
VAEKLISEAISKASNTENRISHGSTSSLLLSWCRTRGSRHDVRVGIGWSIIGSHETTEPHDAREFEYERQRSEYLASLPTDLRTWAASIVYLLEKLLFRCCWSGSTLMDPERRRSPLSPRLLGVWWLWKDCH